MDIKEKGSILAVRLYTGEDTLGSLEKAMAASGKPLGLVVSAAGMMKEIKIGYFTGSGKYSETGYDRPMEIVSLTGNLINSAGKIFSHLHVSLADEKGGVSGGHLRSSKIHGTGEIFIYLSDIAADRRKEEETGLEGLKI
ncbi:MAG: DNA-binding protein [Elusimicrobia bacterium]|nr:DNA-binding protein [Elusimicrobiota bacterium]